VRLGTPVLALADPGGRGLRVTLGHVAAATRPVRGPRGRRIAGAIEHTAPLPRGAAGGPLVDLEGRLLGVNASRLEGGFILALPADAAMRARLAALAQGLTPARPRLGLALARPRNRADGLVVRAVEDASPAAVAGIARGDLLVAVEGRPVHSVDDLFEALEASTGALTLTIVRNRAERDTELHILQ
jgi:serine protease Do